MKNNSTGVFRRQLRRAGAFAAAMLVLSAALLLCGCGNNAQNAQATAEPEASARYTVTADGDFSDDYVSAKLPAGCFIAIDNTASMGTAYHAYLVFKHESDFTGSQIVYFSMPMNAEIYGNMQTDRAQVEAQLQEKFRGRSLTIVDFRNITQENCKGYIVEYKSVANGHEITQILFSGITQNGKFVNFTFNCADESLLEGMRQAANSIVLNTK